MPEDQTLSMATEDIEKLVTAVRRILNFRVTGGGATVKIADDGITIFVKESRPGKGGGGVALLVKIIGTGDDGDGWYKWSEVEWDSTAEAWELTVDGKTSEVYGEAYSIQKHQHLEDGDLVELKTIPDKDGEPIQYINNTPRQFFPVLVAKTAGIAGSKTTACTYVYTVTDQSGRELGTGMTPVKRRTSIGAYVAPDDDEVGMGYYDKESPNVFKLYDANEVPLAEVCN